MLLKSLTDAEKELVVEIGRSRRYAKGDFILREGDPTHSIFLIREGAVQVRKNLDAHRFKQLKDLVAGDFFGDMSFLTAAARSADVVALQDCEILEIPRPAFDKLVQSHAAVGVKVYRNIAVELASRLQRNNEDLKRAITWALEELIS